MWGQAAPRCTPEFAVGWLARHVSLRHYVWCTSASISCRVRVAMRSRSVTNASSSGLSAALNASSARSQVASRITRTARCCLIVCSPGDTHPRLHGGAPRAAQRERQAAHSLPRNAEHAPGSRGSRPQMRGGRRAPVRPYFVSPSRTSPRQAPVSSVRFSMSCLNRSRSPRT
jgi:hypothetical protein